jgi:nucleoside-diphosphate-sugar epimerase
MILITGITGLVGSHLALHLLEKGETIRATYRSEKSIQSTKALFAQYYKSNLFEKIQWVEADILDVSQLEIAFQNIQTVYHCAALVSFDPNDEEKLRKINIEGTANIVNFCIDKKVKELCYVSSIAALGDKKEHEAFIDENSEWNPELFHSDYAISKYGAEMEIWRGQQEGLQVVIVNPGVVIGPASIKENWKNSSQKLFWTVNNGLPFYTKGKTGYVAVTDLVAIMYQLMQQKCFGERFCLVSENKTYQDIVTTIAETLQVKKATINAKPWMIKVMIPIDWLHCLITGKKRDFSFQVSDYLHCQDEFSSKKIKELLKYDFQKIDETIRITAKYFK